MKDIKEFQIGEEVRIREDIEIGTRFSSVTTFSGFIFSEGCSKYKGTIRRVENYASVEGAYKLDIEENVGFISEFFANDFVIGVRSSDWALTHYYKCQFPVALGDKLIVDVNGTEKEVVVTNLNGDAKKATKYVRRKAGDSSSSYQAALEEFSLVSEECTTPISAVNEALKSKVNTTSYLLAQAELTKRLCEWKSTSIEVPDFDDLKLEAARVDHPVAIEVEDTLAVSIGGKRKNKEFKAALYLGLYGGSTIWKPVEF